MEKVDLRQLKIIGYARKSKIEGKKNKEDEKKILSIEDQVKFIHRYVDEHSLKILKLDTKNPIEENQSAYNPGREEFTRLVALIKAGMCDCIITFHISRLSRNPEDSGVIKQLLKDNLLKAIITPEYTYYNNTNDKFMLNISFMLAEKQSDDTSDFVKRDIQGKKDRKEFPNMVCAPYLNIDKEGRISGKSFTAEKMMMLLKLGRPLKRVEIDPIEGGLWRKLGEEIITDTLSLGKAQQRAHELNITGTYSTKPIVKSTIKLTFNNPFIYGMMRTNTGIDPGEHEPLFSKEEFDLINAILSNTKKSKFKVKLENKYNGICVCGECERAWSTESPKRHGKVYLRCSKSRKDYKCTQAYLEISEFERQIEEELKKLQLSTRLIQWIIKQLEKGNEFEIERNDVLRKSLQYKLNLLNQEFDMYSKKWKSLDNINGELVSNTEYIAEKNKYKEAKEELEKQLQNLSLSKEHWIDEIDEFFEFARNLYLTFHNKGDKIEEKRRLLCLIASNITIKDKKIQINYNNKFVIIKRLADLKIEEIPSFEQVNLYQDNEIRVKSSILAELRRG